jgi:hypothetical protein
MKMKRRGFIKASFAAGAALAAPNLLAELIAPSEDHSQVLPWQREIPLREAAKSVTLESVLNPTNPQPAYGGEPNSGFAMPINNLGNL